MEFRVIIAGGRDFDDYELLVERCDHFLSNKSNVVIVSDTARGADQLGEKYAEYRGFPVEKFPADWDKYGKSAGYKRNKQMAEHADALIAFWDGKSKGTGHMINLAREKNIGVKVVNYKK